MGKLAGALDDPGMMAWREAGTRHLPSRFGARRRHHVNAASLAAAVFAAHFPRVSRMPHRSRLTVTTAAPPSLFGPPGRLSPAAAGARCVSLLQLYRANAKAQTVIWRTFGGDVAEVRARTAPLITSFTTTAQHVVQTHSQSRRLTLGTVLGGVACPFKLMALLRAGAESAVVQATFRSAMLEELGRATEALTISERNHLNECIRTLRNYFPADAAEENRTF